MFMFKGLGILIVWILTCFVHSKPIGICKTYFSIIGIEGDALNGQTLCSRTEIPFVYFVLKCNDSNSLKCAKNVQWSALSVCDKAKIHHEEIPVTTALNTIDTSEFSVELSLFIQTEDEVKSVDEFLINTKVDPNDENLKTFVDTVGKLHNTQLEVEFHRVCSLPDKLRSPLQVISYLLRNNLKRRRKRAAATLEYADPGLSELQPSVSSNNGNPYLRDPFPLSKADTDVGGVQFNNVLPNRQTTTKEPFKRFWNKIANQFGRVDNATESDPSITIGLRNPYVTPGRTITPYPGVSNGRSTLEELLFRDNKVSGAVNQDAFTVSPTTSLSSRVTARFITRPDVTVPFTTSSMSQTSTMSSTPLSSTTTTVTTKPITTTRKFDAPEPQTTPSPSTTTTQKFTTPLTTSTTTASSPSTTPELPTTTTSIKPSTSTASTFTSPTTVKQQATLSTKTQNTSTTSTTAATISSPKTSEQTKKIVTTEQPTLKPMVDDKKKITTVKDKNSTNHRISTEPSINTPVPSDETDTSASSSSSRMESTSTDVSGGDDNFWPIVAAMVIGIPSVIVFAIAITVIHKKRSMARPRRGSSLHLHGSYVRNVAARNSISV